MENVFNENVDYLVEARKVVMKLDKTTTQLENQRQQSKKIKRQVEIEEKSITDEINNTIKKRKEEISVSYDKQIEVIREKIKKIQGKRDKKKVQKMNERVVEETADIKEENRKMQTKINTLFKQAHIPSVCSKPFFHSIFMPESFLNYFTLILVSVLILCLVPVGISYLLEIYVIKSANLFVPLIIFSVCELVVFYIYFIINQKIVIKHKDVLEEVRALRIKLIANDDSMRAIKNSINKDKDESIYGLDSYDKKLDRLQEEINLIGKDKQKALTLFENETKNLVVDEINKRRLDKLINLKDEDKKVDSVVSQLENQIQELTLIKTNQYETFLGKDYVKKETLEMMIRIMKEGDATTVSEALKVYKEVEE